MSYSACLSRYKTVPKSTFDHKCHEIKKKELSKEDIEIEISNYKMKRIGANCYLSNDEEKIICEILKILEKLAFLSMKKNCVKWAEILQFKKVLKMSNVICDGQEHSSREILP